MAARFPRSTRSDGSANSANRSIRFKRALLGWAYPVLLWLCAAALFAYAASEDYWQKIKVRSPEEAVTSLRTYLSGDSLSP